MNIENRIRRHQFQHGAMSIIQMGEELIGHPSTAINELVKNSYDADAKKCQVYIHYDKNPIDSFAFIFDNGTGMGEETLFGEWLEPSVSSKRKTGDRRSIVYRRHFLGSKGIGRLASMALGQIVTVISKRKNDILFNWITVNRELFREEKLLSDIDFPGDQINEISDLFKDKNLTEIRESHENINLVKFLDNNNFTDFQEGTLIIIENLDESVIKILEKDYLKQTELFNNTLKKTDFYKSLATLITPLYLSTDIQNELLERNIIQKVNNVADKKSTFIVEFGTNLIPDQEEYSIEWQEIKSIPIHSVYDYRVFGKVDKEGYVKGYFINNRIDNKSYEEPFEITQKEIKDNTLSGKKETDQTASLFKEKQSDDNKKNEAGEYYFDIRVYDIGEKDNLEKLQKKSGFNTVNDFKEAFKSFQGLRVSKNGFGVKPYGEEVEDWIELSKARVQDPGHNVNTNQILGYVYFFSPENDKLEEKTNREGFTENSAFIDVKNTLQVIFRYIGNERYNFRYKENLGSKLKSKHSRPDFEVFLNTIQTQTNLKYIRDYSKKFMKEVTTSMDNLEESLSFSERLASLGCGIELVYHEIQQPISRLQTTQASLGKKKDKVHQDVKDNFLFDIEALGSSTDTLIELKKSLQPVIGRTRKKKFKPYDTFLKVCNLFKSDLEENKISIKTDEKVQNVEIIDLEYAFWISFLNIVNNAVYWIKKSEKKGEIRLHMKRDSFIVSNSGPLINEEIIDYIFEYGVTTRKEKNATGLGLAFTRSTLTNINWEIGAENRNDGPAFIIQRGKK